MDFTMTRKIDFAIRSLTSHNFSWDTQLQNQTDYENEVYWIDSDDVIVENGDAPTWAQVEVAMNTTIAWEDVRRERARKLLASDWTHVTDSKLTTSQTSAWADYRQKLRDIPQDYDAADSVVYPTKP